MEVVYILASMVQNYLFRLDFMKMLTVANVINICK